MRHVPTNERRCRAAALRRGSWAATAAVAGMALAGPAYPQSALPGQVGVTTDPVATAANKTDSATASGGWFSGIKLGLQGEAGIVGNTLGPANNRNFGRLVLDNANRPVLNQVLLTAARPIDPKSASVDIGFNVQVLYGSDARIYQTLGVFDQLIHDRNQLAVIEADFVARFPNVFANGLDVKAGIFPTPLGIEVIDPKANPFYSHSYIGLYGLPFKHTGVLTTSHVSDQLDVYFGVDTGSQTWLAYGWGDNNNRPAGIAGVGLNLLDGKLTVLALTHIGPENSRRSTPFGNSAIRYYNDIAVVYKATDKLIFSLETNYARDDGPKAEAYGVAGYASYALNDVITLNGRAEVYRDNNNFFVATPVGNLDYINSQRGTGAQLLTARRPTTYSEFTLGLTYKPSWAPKAFSTALVRPEVRYDRALNDARPYGDGSNRGVFTLAADVVLGF